MAAQVAVTWTVSIFTGMSRVTGALLAVPLTATDDASLAAAQ